MWPDAMIGRGQSGVDYTLPTISDCAVLAFGVHTIMQVIFLHECVDSIHKLNPDDIVRRLAELLSVSCELQSQ